MFTNRIKNCLKVIGINLGITLFLLGLVIMVPALWSDASAMITRGVEKIWPEKKARAKSPVSDEQPWAADYFSELGKLKTQYYSFIEWRRMPFAGNIITIDQNGFRRHTSQANGPEEAKIWVFGGSTVWGTGSPNDGTLPAQLEKLSGRSTFNFGETGYTSHQSLNMLMRQYIAGGKPDVVIFYDGANDVAHKCRSGFDFYSTGLEQQMREKLKKQDSEFLSLFKPIVNRLMNKTAKKSKYVYDCHTDKDKLSRISKNLALDWAVARNIVEANGGRFIAILEPVAYIGTPEIRYLRKKDRDPILKMQFEIAYPEFRRELETRKISFYDLTNIFNGDDRIYTDYCHITPAGNEKIARFISGIL